MAVMVFRRTVIESRRKPKGLLRPKTRANLKELLNVRFTHTLSVIQFTLSYMIS